MPSSQGIANAPFSVILGKFRILKHSREKGHFICPNCGAEVRVGASACPECGSDEKTGWSEEAESGFNEYPAGYGEDADFNYNEFLRREFGHKPDAAPKILTKKNIINAITVLLVIALFWLWVF